MDKVKIAKTYLEMVKLNAEYLNRIPKDIAEAIFDNQYSENLNTYLHLYLEQLLTTEQFEDLMYFAYESNPRIEYEGQEYTDIFSWWLNRYAIE